MNEYKIYLLFTNTRTILTKLIKLYTKDSLNHVSIAFDEQLREVYSFGRKKPYNPFIGGFVKEKLNEGLMKHADCALYSLKVTKHEYEKMKKAVKKIEENKDLYKYNFLGLFAILLNKRLEREYAFFCSEFVSTILSVKKNLLKKTPSFVTPKDLMQLEGLRLVYEGKLSSYTNSSGEISFQYSIRVF